MQGGRRSESIITKSQFGRKYILVSLCSTGYQTLIAMKAPTVTRIHQYQMMMLGHVFLTKEKQKLSLLRFQSCFLFFPEGIGFYCSKSIRNELLLLLRKEQNSDGQLRKHSAV